MADRTFGWIQNPSNTRNLQKVVALFVASHSSTQELLNRRIPLLRENGLLHDEPMWGKYVEAIESGQPISYAFLKGKGSGSRSEAKCSGIVQAIIEAQKSISLIVDGEKQTAKKPYTDDWTADGYLRWAISIGFVAYDSANDSCTITNLGREFIHAVDGEAFAEVLGRAFVQYPPICRVLLLLQSGVQLTKFEIGRQLGFTTEAGFTSLPQNIYAQSWCEDAENRSQLRSNYEGSSDKYARMICKWLKDIGWVASLQKSVTESVGDRAYTVSLTSYTITAKGLKALKMALGKSSVKRAHKIVPFQMLATKGDDIDYRRHRRAYTIKYIERHARTVEQIQSHLASKGFCEQAATILDDLAGFASIGLNVVDSRNGFEIKDNIDGLNIPANASIGSKSAASDVKDRVRPLLSALDHRFLTLIDLSFDGNMNREFEIMTIDLFTNELGFGGKHLGGSRKPDGVIYKDGNGLIIDNKAYSTGFSIPRSQIDEMTRYLQENNERNEVVNPNRWWEVFPPSMSEFFYAFISSHFTGQISPKLVEIKNRTGVRGGAIDSENLLYVAESIKRGALSYNDFFAMFDCKEMRLTIASMANN